jgi:type I restriction enzyme S subunit
MVNVMGKQLIPAGYKLTEVGVIPEDWQDSVIGSVAEFVGGSQPPKSTFKSIESPGYIRLIQIRDYKKDTYITFIPEHLAQKKCNSEDIMIGRYGPPIFQILRGIKGAYNVALIKAIPNEKIVRDFLFYSLKSERLFQLMEILSQRSSGQTGVDLPALKAYPLALPVREEQTAIATALFDVDALIAALEKLINKKSAIKTAAMQQLLTGKKRLPPFDQLNTGYRQTELGEIPGDWEVASLGEIGETIIGLTYSPNDVSDFGTLVLRSSNVQNNRLTFDNNVFVNMVLPDRVIVREADVLVCVRNGSRQLIGKCALIDAKTAGCAFGAFMSIYRSKNSRFVFYQFQSNIIQDQINEVMGATINQITNKDMASFRIPLPRDEKEQTAIANVLSDIDKEIEALQQRLHKTQQIKQGMMQELLTGKTRLVK